MFLLIRKSDRDQKRDRISLNSIMFLLIPQCKLCTVRAVLALNSIMFLLIQLTGTQKRIQKINFKFHYVSINSKLKSILTGEQAALNSIMFLLIHTSTNQQHDCLCPLNSIMFLLIPVPKPTAYLLHETPLFCRPLQNISFLSHSSSYVLVTPPILAIFYFCRFPAFFTLSQVDRNHYIFIISSFLLA